MTKLEVLGMQPVQRQLLCLPHTEINCHREESGEKLLKQEKDKCLRRKIDTVLQKGYATRLVRQETGKMGDNKWHHQEEERREARDKKQRGKGEVPTDNFTREICT